MEVRKSNKLPEGVGKKIVEALKQQENPSEESYSLDNDIQVEYDETSQEASWEKESPQEYIEESDEAQDEYAEEYSFDDYQEEQVDDSDFEAYEYYESDEQPEQVQPVYEPQPPVNNTPPTPIERPRLNIPEMPELKPEPAPVFQKASAEVPPNIEVLIRLISQLPPSVTRQTGAQIIRQTMEAMGISMNSVLSEAQLIQEGLGQSVRNNVNKIEEYRNNIKILEQDVQNLKKEAAKLEDLINLFIMTDK